MDKPEQITPDVISRELDQIAGATLEEELERKRLGLPPEPQALHDQRKIPLETKEVFSESKKDIKSYVDEWLWANPKEKYKFSNISPEGNQIGNFSGIEVPPHLVDTVISNIKTIIAQNERLKASLKYYENIKMVGIFKDSTFAVSMAIKNAVGWTLIFFNDKFEVANDIYYFPL